MTSLPSLDVMIGMFLVYTVLSLVCSGLSEVVSSVLALRARTLKSGLANLLNDPTGGLVRVLYDHPLINSLRRDRLIVLNRWHSDGPSEIPPPVFVDALLDTLIPGGRDAQGRSVAEVIGAIEASTLLNADTKKLLVALAGGALGNYAQLRDRWMAWYDDSTAALSRWYGREMQFVSIGLALLITLALNVDTFALINGLSGDLKLRSALVSAASTFVEAHAVQGSTVVTTSPPQGSTAPATGPTGLVAANGDLDFDRVRKAIETTQQAINLIPLPLGWPVDPAHPFPSLFWQASRRQSTLFGWFFSTVALSMGAPFWFDLLNQAVGLRQSSSRPNGGTAA